MDACFSAIGYYYNPFSGSVKDVINAVADGATDVFESWVFLIVLLLAKLAHQTEKYIQATPIKSNYPQ